MLGEKPRLLCLRRTPKLKYFSGRDIAQKGEEEAEEAGSTIVDSAVYMKDQNLGKNMKTFIGFVQILSVSDTVLKFHGPMDFCPF